MDVQCKRNNKVSLSVYTLVAYIRVFYTFYTLVYMVAYRKGCKHTFNEMKDGDKNNKLHNINSFHKKIIKSIFNGVSILCMKNVRLIMGLHSIGNITKTKYYKKRRMGK